jgi:hypothetical protein
MTPTAARIHLSTLITTLTFLSACGSEGDPTEESSTTIEGPDGQMTASGTPSASAGPASGTTSTGGVVSPSVSPGAGVASGGASGSETPGSGSGMAGGPSAMGGTSNAGGTSGGGGASGSGQAGGAGGTEPGAAGAGGSGAPGGAGGMSAAGGMNAGGTSGVGGTSAAGGGGGSETSPLPPVEDYSDLGPYGTTSEEGTGPDGTYTVVRPETLGEDGFLHAPITFGPGTGMQVSQMMGLLERFASHGFVVIGRQLDGGPGDPVTRERLIGGLDWIIEQNSTAGSVFEGMIDVDHAIAMGYSVGGTGAVEIGGHEAIATVVSIHGHGAEGDLHSPLLLIGGTEDVMGDGLSWLAPTYEASQVQTFFGTVVGADHGYIQGSVDGVQGGVETPAIIAWMRYWIYNDQEAARYFEGDDCVMCDDPWTNPQRKNWP